MGEERKKERITKAEVEVEVEVEGGEKGKMRNNGSECGKGVVRKEEEGDWGNKQ